MELIHRLDTEPEVIQTGNDEAEDAGRTSLVPRQADRGSIHKLKSLRETPGRPSLRVRLPSSLSQNPTAVEGSDGVGDVVDSGDGGHVDDAAHRH